MLNDAFSSADEWNSIFDGEANEGLDTLVSCKTSLGGNGDFLAEIDMKG
jgi:hypothetical protein